MAAGPARDVRLTTCLDEYQAPEALWHRVGGTWMEVPLPTPRSPARSAWTPTEAVGGRQPRAGTATTSTPYFLLSYDGTISAKANAHFGPR